MREIKQKHSNEFHKYWNVVSGAVNFRIFGHLNCYRWAATNHGAIDEFSIQWNAWEADAKLLYSVRLRVAFAQQTIMYAIIKEGIFSVFGACWHSQTLLSVLSAAMEYIYDHFLFCATPSPPPIPLHIVIFRCLPLFLSRTVQSCHLITIVIDSYMCRILIAATLFRKTKTVYVFFLFVGFFSAAVAAAATWVFLLHLLLISFSCIKVNAVCWYCSLSISTRLLKMVWNSDGTSQQTL